MENWFYHLSIFNPFLVRENTQRNLPLFLFGHMTPSYHLSTGRARVAWNELRVNFWRKVGFQLQYNAGSLEREEEEDFYYLNLLVVHGRHMYMYMHKSMMYMYITLSTPYQNILYNVLRVSSVQLM